MQSLWTLAQRSWFSKFLLLETPGYWLRNWFLATYKPEHQSWLHPLSVLCFWANDPSRISVIWSVQWGTWYLPWQGCKYSMCLAQSKQLEWSSWIYLFHCCQRQSVQLLSTVTCSSKELRFHRVGCGGICFSLLKPKRRRKKRKTIFELLNCVLDPLKYLVLFTVHNNPWCQWYPIFKDEVTVHQGLHEAVQA